MTVSTLKPAAPTPERAELVPQYFDTELIVTPADNPAPTPARLAELLESMREHGQLVPGFVCPSPELTEGKRLGIEGMTRLAIARQLGIKFWAFDLGRFVPEEERIKLTFQHNHSRRVMGREEIAQRAARYIELTRCSAADAAKHLNVSPPTLSRAFGEQRIPPELRERADRLGLSIRALVAAMPVPLMAKAMEFAETPLGGTDRKPTRDQVSLFLQQLKKTGTQKTGRGKSVTLRFNGRPVTIRVGDKDTAYNVSEDFKSIAAKLGKHAEVPPEGWPFLFQ